MYNKFSLMICYLLKKIRRRSRAERFALLLPSEGTLGSNLDVRLPSYVAGWALDLTRVTQPVNINVYVNDDFFLEICADGQRDDLCNIIPEIVGGGFEFVPPPGTGRATISIRYNGQDLRGSPFEVELQPQRKSPNASKASLSAEVRQLASKLPSEGILASSIDVCLPTHVVGWAVDMMRPSRPIELDVTIDGSPFTTVRADGPRGDLSQIESQIKGGGFEFSLPPGNGSATVAIRYKGQDLRGSPFHIELQPRPMLPSLARYAEASELKSPSPSITIVVPVYNAPAEVAACLEAVVRYTTREATLLVIDDASPDPAIQDILLSYRDRDRINVFRNPENLGYTRTINKGIRESELNDVVLLNSDTRVGPRWLENLHIAAYSRSSIASVTAVSDNAGAFTVPRMNQPQPLPRGLSLEQYQRGVTQTSGCYWPDVPTGNGFCIYLRRDALDVVGLFDEQAFPRGYGEENDWAMRALRAGWRHLVDDRTLVHHERSASFGETKTELLRAARAVIDERYPEYESLIEVFAAGRTLNCVRYKVGELHATHRKAHESSAVGAGSIRPRLLFVISTQTGGTPLTNRDLMDALSGSYEPWLLICDRLMVRLFRVGAEGADSDSEMERHVLSDPITLADHSSTEYDEMVARWLVQYAIELMHIRHIGWHSLKLASIAQGLDVPVVFSFHDFYSVCPTVKLLDENLNYCGGHCTRTEGDCVPELWPAKAVPPLKERWVHEWRRKFSHVFDSCDAFVTTSSSAKATIIDAFPSLDNRTFRVIPHGRDFDTFMPPKRATVAGKALDILVPGHISPAKGRNIIAALAARDCGRTLRFHLMGSVHPPLEGKGIVNHGKYRREEFATRLQEIAPDIGAIFSVWSETYCHTLTELWASGLPVVGFDFGAVAERIRATGAGWIFEHRDISRLYEQLLLLASSAGNIQQKYEAVSRWQKQMRQDGNCEAMARKYFKLYEEVIEKRRPFSNCKRPDEVLPVSPDRSAIKIVL